MPNIKVKSDLVFLLILVSAFTLVPFVFLWCVGKVFQVDVEYTFVTWLASFIFVSLFNPFIKYRP